MPRKLKVTTINPDQFKSFSFDSLLKLCYRLDIRENTATHGKTIMIATGRSIDGFVDQASTALDEIEKTFTDDESKAEIENDRQALIAIKATKAS